MQTYGRIPVTFVAGDGSWLVDGGLPVEALEDLLDSGPLPGREEHQYTTVAGFVLHQLGRIPQPADHFTWDVYRFEVVDMDGRRVDKVLVSEAGGRAERI